MAIRVGHQHLLPVIGAPPGAAQPACSTVQPALQDVSSKLLAVMQLIAVMARLAAGHGRPRPTGFDSCQTVCSRSWQGPGPLVLTAARPFAAGHGRARTTGLDCSQTVLPGHGKGSEEARSWARASWEWSVACVWSCRAGCYEEAVSLPCSLMTQKRRVLRSLSELSWRPSLPALRRRSSLILWSR